MSSQIKNTNNNRWSTTFNHPNYPTVPPVPLGCQGGAPSHKVETFPIYWFISRSTFRFAVQDFFSFDFWLVLSWNIVNTVHGNRNPMWSRKWFRVDLIKSSTWNRVGKSLRWKILSPTTMLPMLEVVALNHLCHNRPPQARRESAELRPPMGEVGPIWASNWPENSRTSSLTSPASRWEIASKDAFRRRTKLGNMALWTCLQVQSWSPQGKPEQYKIDNSFACCGRPPPFNPCFLCGCGKPAFPALFLTFLSFFFFSFLFAVNPVAVHRTWKKNLNRGTGLTKKQAQRQW